MDETDRDIIEALLEKEHTAHELAKILFKTEDQRELRKHYTFLKYRLGRLAEDGLVRRRNYKPASYFVPLEDLLIGRARIVVDNGSETIELQIGKVIVVEHEGEVSRVLLLQA